MNVLQNFKLPKHDTRRHVSVRACIDCASHHHLTDEHIVAFAAGGRWVLLAALTQCPGDPQC